MGRRSGFGLKGWFCELWREGRAWKEGRGEEDWKNWEIRIGNRE